MFDDIKVNDEVDGGDEILAVTKVTPKQFVAGKMTFRKDDGRRIGAYGGAKPLTPERRNELQARAHRKKLCSAIRSRGEDIEAGSRLFYSGWSYRYESIDTQTDIALLEQLLSKLQDAKALMKQINKAREQK